MYCISKYNGQDSNLALRYSHVHILLFEIRVGKYLLTWYYGGSVR